MIYIIRAKAVSQCVGIRRAIVTYFKYEDGIIDLKDYEHPLKNFKSIKLLDGYAEVLGTSNKLELASDVFFYKNNKVLANDKEENEIMTLGLMLMPLDIKMKEYYETAISDGFFFDQWNGEFEYLLGLMYKLDLNDLDLSEEYFNKALKKGFKFNMKE